MIAILLIAAEAAGLQGAFKSVKQDGPVQLPETAQQEIVATLPPARKGEECPEPAKVATEAAGLRDRGDGAVIVAQVTTCKGGRVFALGPGQPPRIARLLDYQQAEEVRSAKAMNLGGGNRERDLALELLVSPTLSEVRLFARSDTGFSFTDAGTLKDYNALRECASGAEDGSGWSSFVRNEKEKLAVLRVDDSCTGGAWQASCLLYRFDKGALARAGVCSLPPKLDPKALKAAGWK